MMGGIDATVFCAEEDEHTDAKGSREGMRG